MKVVDAVFNSVLPPDVRKSGRVLDAKGIGRVLAEVADRHPEKYAETIKAIGDLGRHASYLQGETMGLDDLVTPFDKKPYLKKLEDELVAVDDDAKLNPVQKKAKRLEIMSAHSDAFEKLTMDAGRASYNNVVMSIASGARGKAPQAKAMIGVPGLYADFSGKVIPFFVSRSVAEGLRPAEYLASTFGARSTVTSTKVATAKGGDLLKQVVQTAGDTVVTEKDCGTMNGIDLDSDDPSLKGRVLVNDYDGVKGGTFIDGKISGLFAKTPGRVIVRSPMTCQSKRGVCSKCAGAIAGNKQLPKVGAHVGITAGQALFEPVTQAALSQKHCVLNGTEVRMANLTTKPIETIVPGDMVLGSDINGNTFPVKVLHTWDQGIQDVYRYTYRKGQTRQYLELSCTTEHPVLSNKKVTSLHNKIKYDGKYGYGCPEDFQSYKLPAGYPHKDLAAVLPVACESEAFVHEPLALMYGALLGDGIRFNPIVRGPPCFSCADPTLAEDLNALLAKHGLILKKCKRSHDWRVVQLHDDVGRSRSVETGRMLAGATRHLMIHKVEEWGLSGKYCHEKTISDAILRTWDKPSVSALIAGFIATDGSVYKNEDGHIAFNFGSSSKPMLEALKWILEVRLCVYASPIHPGQKAGTGVRKHDQWTFVVSRQDQVRKLASLITIPGVKGPRLQEYLKNATYELRNSEPFFRAKKVKTEFLGKLPCWDISVDHPDELFVLANGLIVKNTAGAYKGKKTFSGFPVINQLVQAPDEFPHRAAVAERDGYVDSVEDAPQGGKHVTIDGEKHYVLPGMDVMVKAGQKVTAGTQLSDGIVDPSDIIRLRGLGEGRRYYADRLKQALDDSGHAAHRRNVEMLARTAVDHVSIDSDDGYGDYLPDDVASYNALMANYTPSQTARPVSVGKEAWGKFLAAPALHYSVGTKITSDMTDRLEKAGIGSALIDDAAPPFTPIMKRIRTQGQDDPDWMAKQTTSYLKSNLTRDAARGRDTNVEANTHFAPRLAYGKDFGKNVEETGSF